MTEGDFTNSRSTRMHKLIQATSFAALLALSGAGQATELNFNIPSFSLTGVNASYGDRVSSFGSGYGSAGGATPNIVVDFVTNNNSNFTIYASGYASLVNALGHSSFNVPGYVQLTPDAGFDVVLMGFQVAGWSVSSYPNSRIRVIDLASNSFLDTGLFTFGTNTVLSYPAQPIRSSLGLRIMVDDFGDLGLDNLVFGQVASVPEASTVTMLLAGLVAVGGLARRRGVLARAPVGPV